MFITLRRDGRLQSSNVVYAVSARQLRISVTEDRGKTRNLRRDPRVAPHVSTPDGSAWAAVEDLAALSPVSTTPGDETGGALVQLDVAISGSEHPVGTSTAARWSPSAFSC